MTTMMPLGARMWLLDVISFWSASEKTIWSAVKSKVFLTFLSRRVRTEPGVREGPRPVYHPSTTATCTPALRTLAHRHHRPAWRTGSVTCPTVRHRECALQTVGALLAGYIIETPSSRTISECYIDFHPGTLFHFCLARRGWSCLPSVDPASREQP